MSAIGCATWQPVRRERIATVLQQSKPEKARVGAGGSVLEIRNPVVRADTLRGTLRENRRTRVEIPLAQVDSLSLYRNRRARSSAAAGFAITATMVFLALAFVHAPPPVRY